ncbi:MAG: thiamine pyrophosphate-dependent enzyme [Myxococcota bacterium]|nr:thiamine pyrophosphate-dependent enzyme [Myxococcota bacterium]
MSSPIGTQLPHAVGVAWAMKLRGRGDVAVGYMGDGATSENDFHTSMNMAAHHELPVIFFCQNNQWAISVPVEKQSAAATMADRAAAYRMPAARVDGNDVMAVFAAMEQAVERARRGEGPSLIEALTYRMGAHSTSDDPSRYRDETVTEAWKERDPITRLRIYLESEGLQSAEQAEALSESLGKDIRKVLEAVERADAAPALDTMFDDVFADRTWLLEEQAAEIQRYAR